MNKTYISSGMKAVSAESMKEAAYIFARRLARKTYGAKGDARTVQQGSYSQDGSLAEYGAFIGLTRKNETSGHNVNFTVQVK